ncbi:hypothetical protein KP509_24G057400 [Ceratopteris richardii]|nr:hypothetical protein KP509_24G057400 [Ceratopteris richardii]
MIHGTLSKGISINFRLATSWHMYSACKAPSWTLKSRRFQMSTVSAVQIDVVPCLKDNYAYLLHDTEAGVTGVIDPSEAKPIIEVLKKKDLDLSFILNTHHHWDHTGGNIDLKRRYNAKVVGPYADKDRIPGIDVALKDGDTWMFGNEKMLVLDTPGHTRGHVCFYFSNLKAIFTGDTLFSLSCGKLFEGTAQQMWTSLSKIMALPDETLVYCGHEYTLSNAEFSLSLEPSNAALQSYYIEVKELRQSGRPTIPTTLGREKACNPFLRVLSDEIRSTVGIPPGADEVQALAAVRARKDKW